MSKKDFIKKLASKILSVSTLGLLLWLYILNLLIYKFLWGSEWFDRWLSILFAVITAVIIYKIYVVFKEQKKLKSK